MNRFGLYGKLIAKDGERDNLAAILLEAAAGLETLEECELYMVNLTETEPNSVFVYEVWRSEEAHRASLSLEVTQNLIRRAKPIMAGMERMNTLEPIGGKGINSDF